MVTRRQYTLAVLFLGVALIIEGLALYGYAGALGADSPVPFIVLVAGAAVLIGGLVVSLFFATWRKPEKEKILV